MTLPLKTFQQLVSDMVATFAAQTNTTPVFSDGDVLLSWWQSVAVQLDFLQAQIKLVVALARAQTSTGADLDSWMAQFGFFRLQATDATGPELFQKSTAAAVAVTIPIGSIVQSAGGAVQYQVVADADEVAFNAALNAYVLPVGQTSVTATIQALVAGSGSDVVTGALNQLGSSVPGIDSVTNPAPITNGFDAETDEAFRARFVLFLATLAKATRTALLAAATSVQQGLAVNLMENVLGDGTPLMGSFTAIIDDGSGSPPTSLLNSVYAALDVTRAFSVQPFVIDPTLAPVSVAIPVRLLSTSVIAVTNTAVQSAVVLAINALPPGATLYVSALVNAALAVDGVVSVQTSGVLLNGVNADLVATVQQEIRAVTNSVIVTNY